MTESQSRAIRVERGVPGGLEAADAFESGRLGQRLRGDPGPVDAGIPKCGMLLPKALGFGVGPRDDDGIGRLEIAADFQTA